MKPDDFDFMELGDTGWVPMPDGTYVNIKSNQMMDENGMIISLEDEDDGVE
jgi:hypothetical protein